MIVDPLNMTTVKNTLQSWVSNLTGMTWVWGNQDASQPPYPYGVIQIVSGPIVVNQMTDERIFDATTETMCYRGWRQMTVSFTANVDSADEAIDPSSGAVPICSYIQSSASTIESIQEIGDGGISVVGKNPIVPLDLVVNDHWVNRASVELVILITSVLDETVTTVDKITYSGTVGTAAGDIQIDETTVGV